MRGRWVDAKNSNKNQLGEQCRLVNVSVETNVFFGRKYSRLGACDKSPTAGNSLRKILYCYKKK